VTVQIEHIGVICAGYMGGGIAQVFTPAGLDVAKVRIGRKFDLQLPVTLSETGTGRKFEAWQGATFASSGSVQS